jgi:hypothetical protein
VEEPEPTTQELRAVQREREVAERDAAGQAQSDVDARTHARRAEKASYLEETLAEQERALEEESTDES